MLRPPALLLAGLLLASCASPATRDASIPSGAHREDHVPVMPDLHGLDSVEAYGVLSDLGLPVRDDSFVDLSILHRETDGVHDWTVWSSVPASGEEVPPGTDLHLFVLKQREWQFFDRHARMPRMPVRPGRAVPSPYPMPFQDVVSELVEWRYDPRHTPRDSPRTTDWPRPSAGIPAEVDLSAEPPAERLRRARYREAEAFGNDLFVRLAQPPGTPLRPGQMITILVRPRPETHPELYPSYTGPGSREWEDRHETHLHVGGDDDVDVPGWLCPTRFC